MQGAPEKMTGADGLPVAPHALYNIGNSHPENLLDFVTTLQEELVRRLLPKTTTLKPTNNWCPCSPATCR